MELLSETKLIIEIIAGGIALGVTIWGGRKVIVASWKKRSRRRDMYAKVDAIYLEVKPNGGTSLRDAVNRIDRRGRFNEGRQRMNMEEVGVSAFEMDAQGALTYANQAMCELLCRGEDDLLGYRWKTSVDAADRTAMNAEILKAVTEEKRGFVVTFRIHLGKQQSIVVLMKTVPVYCERGELEGFNGTIRLETENR